MSEGAPKSEKLSEETYLRLAEELSQHLEGFPFPGISPDAYAKLQADIAADKERSLYDISSPTLDELVERFRIEGMKVVRGRSADGTYGRTVLIMPKGSTDVQNESVLPRHLEIRDDMNPKLKRLILANRKPFLK